MGEEMWWESEEDEYVEEEGAFEPEPKEPEERSKFVKEKGQQFRVFDPGGANTCVCECECCWCDSVQWRSLKETYNKTHRHQHVPPGYSMPHERRTAGQWWHLHSQQH